MPPQHTARGESAVQERPRRVVVCAGPLGGVGGEAALSHGVVGRELALRAPASAHAVLRRAGAHAPGSAARAADGLRHVEAERSHVGAIGRKFLAGAQGLSSVAVARVGGGCRGRVGRLRDRRRRCGGGLRRCWWGRGRWCLRGWVGAADEAHHRQDRPDRASGTHGSEYAPGDAILPRGRRSRTRRVGWRAVRQSYRTLWPPWPVQVPMST